MTEFLKRAISGIVYVILIIGSALYDKVSFYVVFYVFMLFCLYEMKKLIDLKFNWTFVTATLLYLTFIQQSLISNQYLYPMVIASLFLPFVYLLLQPNKTISTIISRFLLALVYVALPFAFVASIPFFKGSYHPYIIISVFVMIWANDTFAYLVGRSFGKTKLYEKISPNKTIEGALGGFVAGLVAAYFISKYVTILSLSNWIIIAIIVFIFGSIGDLIESKFKRDANVKDSSNFIPGHGGFLDRLDSIIFAAPFVYVYLHIINLT